MEYDERPAEWEEERFFRIDRRMHSGPVAGIDMRFYFEPRGAGSQVRIHLTFDPKTALLTPILKMRARQSIDQIAREIERIDQTLARGQRPSLPSHGKVNEEALGAALRNLRGKADEGLVGRLAALLREGDDVEVARLRPYELADQWGVGRRPLLETMLEGVKAGLFELRWEMICPSCRVAVWSHYPTAREAAAFVRAGTLDDKQAIAPDVHIFTASKARWLTLGDGKPAFEAFYGDRPAIWGRDAIDRWEALMAGRK